MPINQKVKVKQTTLEKNMVKFLETGKKCQKSALNYIKEVRQVISRKKNSKVEIENKLRPNNIAGLLEIGKVTKETGEVKLKNLDHSLKNVQATIERIQGLSKAAAEVPKLKNHLNEGKEFNIIDRKWTVISDLKSGFEYLKNQEEALVTEIKELMKIEQSADKDLRNASKKKEGEIFLSGEKVISLILEKYGKEKFRPKGSNKHVDVFALIKEFFGKKGRIQETRKEFHKCASIYGLMSSCNKLYKEGKISFKILNEKYDVHFNDDEKNYAGLKNSLGILKKQEEKLAKNQNFLQNLKKTINWDSVEGITDKKVHKQQKNYCLEIEKIIPVLNFWKNQTIELKVKIETLLKNYASEKERCKGLLKMKNTRVEDAVGSIKEFEVLQKKNIVNNITISNEKVKQLHDEAFCFHEKVNEYKEITHHFDTFVKSFNPLVTIGNKKQTNSNKVEKITIKDIILDKTFPLTVAEFRTAFNTVSQFKDESDRLLKKLEDKKDKFVKEFEEKKVDNLKSHDSVVEKISIPINKIQNYEKIKKNLDSYIKTASSTKGGYDQLFIEFDKAHRDFKDGVTETVYRKLFNYFRGITTLDNYKTAGDIDTNFITKAVQDKHGYSFVETLKGLLKDEGIDEKTPIREVYSLLAKKQNVKKTYIDAITGDVIRKKEETKPTLKSKLVDVSKLSMEEQEKLFKELKLKQGEKKPKIEKKNELKIEKEDDLKVGKKIIEKVKKK